MAKVRLVIAVAALGAMSAGLVLSLVGPAWGRLVGPAAFPVIVGMLIFLGVRKGPFTPIVDGRPAVYGMRTPIRFAAGLCLMFFVTAIAVEVVASRGAGVADGGDPVFQTREVYQLANHGVYTSVTRGRYLVVGAAFVVGWHAFGMFAALLVLDLVLFGSWRRR